MICLSKDLLIIPIKKVDRNLYSKLIVDDIDFSLYPVSLAYNPTVSVKNIEKGVYNSGEQNKI